MMTVDQLLDANVKNFDGGKIVGGKAFFPVVLFDCHLPTLPKGGN